MFWLEERRKVKIDWLITKSRVLEGLKKDEIIYKPNNEL
jgi:hypothetical protein